MTDEELGDVDLTLKDEWGGYKLKLKEVYDGTTSTVQDDNTGYKSVTELFDKNEEGKDAKNYDENKLHIGDFVNYDAGIWTKEDIEAIQVGPKDNLVSANNSDSLPSTAFQFGGFKEGDSRNENATPYSNSYNYVKDENNQPITDWRVFDVDDDGNITLISAGCPEDYYVPSVSTNNGYGGYISEYILSGNVNTSATSLNLESSYTKRDWSKYVNTSQHATEATVLTKSKLDKWYDKYMGTTNANTYTNSTFRTINGTRYDNLINNYSYYWLSAANGSYSVYRVNPRIRLVDGNYSSAFGVRPVVSLTSDVQLAKEGTKTVKDAYEEGKTYTYNVWDIK